MTPFFHPTYIISILIAISIHEWAHGFTAHRLGDPTPQRAGRLTLNPVAHLDLIGALMFLMVGFGWAKPVPINPTYFRHPKRDTALTALAGPVSNFILALFAFALLVLLARGEEMTLVHLLDDPSGKTAWMTILLQILKSSLFVNLALMAFNLFPIAPLDGSKIVQIFIPFHLEDRYEEFMRIGPFILLFLLLFESFLPFPLLSSWVHTIMEGVLNLFSVLMSLYG